MEREVEIPCGRGSLKGILHVPADTEGVVVFAHGSGSGRFSPRNQYVAEVLQQGDPITGLVPRGTPPQGRGGGVRGGLATLLIDLLLEEEADDRENVFDIELLAERLQQSADWLRQETATRHLRLGYFGASTGAGAALVAAARQPNAVAAVVSRGGRPDLADAALPAVQAPTLLIVGGNDQVVLDLNEQALRLLRCPKELVVVPGATHLFEEPGALEEVARLATNWFQRYLSPVAVKPDIGDRQDAE